ncbi:SRPBCC family protein [Bdellovibrio sp. 22V]|uniref:SRPBCC family protein n=1 Tax=Bdellovibrio TaxID=958 RepID=UPI002543A496|nr:SRPBCC family protein [Bdellovibrio sp. 22V]WII72624.1 SRPBCC family protein [Bdellovibrio sp. 22V]
MAGTVQLHRVLAAPPERVFRALTNPDAMVKWLPPHGFIAKMHEIDFRVGGGYRMSFTNLTTNQSQSFGGKYTEIKPNELLKYTDKFDDPNLPGEMHVVVSLRKVMGGTELKITQDGIPDAIPVEMCYLGWQQSLQLLTQLVEPEINEM